MQSQVGKLTAEVDLLEKQRDEARSKLAEAEAASARVASTTVSEKAELQAKL